MNLNEAQHQKVAAWVAEGLKLAEIQTRLASELQVRLTYMEVRLLVDDLKLKLRDPEPAKPLEKLISPSSAVPAGEASAAGQSPLQPQPAAPVATGGVSVSVDQLARPGALVSGKVTFSDGVTAEWYLDQTGRLGVVPKQPGYKPPAADVPQFQMALENELAKMGF